MYIDKFDEIVNRYSNTHHRTIIIKPVEMYIAFNKENNKKGPKFKVGDHVKVSKCKNFNFSFNFIYFTD